MESRVSNKSTRNIVRPSQLTRGQRKGKIARGRQTQKSTHAQILILAKFYTITYYFGQRKQGSITFLWVEFPNICWTVKHICGLPSAC